MAIIFAVLSRHFSPKEGLAALLFFCGVKFPYSYFSCCKALPVPPNIEGNA